MIQHGENMNLMLSFNASMEALIKEKGVI